MLQLMLWVLILNGVWLIIFFLILQTASWFQFQVLRQLAPDVSYRNLVALGIASIQGLAVASFEREDAERLLYFCSQQGKNGFLNNLKISSPPSWLRPPPPSRKRSSICQEISSSAINGSAARSFIKKEDNEERDLRLFNGISMPVTTSRQKIKIAALRPIPHVRHQKMLPFSRILVADMHDGGQVKSNLPVPPAKHSTGTTPASHRKSTSSAYQAKQVISLNPLPLKKHGCGRSPLHVCSEVNFFNLHAISARLSQLEMWNKHHLSCFLLIAEFSRLHVDFDIDFQLKVFPLVVLTLFFIVFILLVRRRSFSRM